MRRRNHIYWILKINIQDCYYNIFVKSLDIREQIWFSVKWGENIRLLMAELLWNQQEETVKFGKFLQVLQSHLKKFLLPVTRVSRTIQQFINLRLFWSNTCCRSTAKRWGVLFACLAVQFTCEMAHTLNTDSVVTAKIYIYLGEDIQKL